MKLKGALPKEEKNGLSVLAKQAAKKPSAKHLVIAVIDAAGVEVYPDEEVKWQILRIESVPPAQQMMIATLLESIFEERTGKTSFDLGIEDDLDMRNVFKEPTTGPRTRRFPKLFEQPGIGATSNDVIDAEIVEDETETGADETSDDSDATSAGENETDEDPLRPDGEPPMFSDPTP